MKKPGIAQDERSRLETLRSLNILDTAAAERFDRLTRMAKRMFGVPIALVSLVDENRQWFKSCVGLSATETSRDISFCGHAILGDKESDDG
jgi:GAF domain-containing protein